MKTLARLVSISILLTGAFGCSAGSSEKVAADEGAQAAGANAHVAAADAHLTAADANVDAAAADARVKAGAENTGAFQGAAREIHLGPETRLNVTLANSVQM